MEVSSCNEASCQLTYSVGLLGLIIPAQKASIEPHAGNRSSASLDRRLARTESRDNWTSSGPSPETLDVDV
jgi:hypothetical protein